MPSENKPRQESPGSTDEVPRRKFDYCEHAILNKERKFIQWIQDSHPSLYKKLTASSKHNSVTLKEVLPALLGQLQNKDSAQRQIALQVIYQSTTTDDRYPSVWKMTRTPTGNIIKGVLGCLRDSDLTVRREAVRTLSGFLPTSFVDASFVKALADDGVRSRDAETAKTSIALLPGIRTDLRSFAVPSLISALHHSDEAVRQAACRVLGGLGPDSIDAVPKLVQLAISDPSDEVRVAAVDGVLKIAGRKTAVELFGQYISKLPSLIDLLRVAGESFRELRYDLQAPQRESQDKPGMSVTESADGPVPPDKFALEGKVYGRLAPKPFGLVEVLWTARFRSANYAELAKAVWGEPGLDLGHYDLGSARSKANRFFIKHKIPYRIKLVNKNRRASLVDLRQAANSDDS
jgi:hypothetical protein